MGAAVIVLWSSIETSSARFEASTGSDGVFAAGSVVLERASTSSRLLFNADGLYPGAGRTGCVVLEYRGSLPASVRLHARLGGGTGLEEFIDLTLFVVPGDDCEAATPFADPVATARTDGVAPDGIGSEDASPGSAGSDSAGSGAAVIGGGGGRRCGRRLRGRLSREPRSVRRVAPRFRPGPPDRRSGRSRRSPAAVRGGEAGRRQCGPGPRHRLRSDRRGAGHECLVWARRSEHGDDERPR